MNAGWVLIVDVAVDSMVEDEWNDWYDNEHLPEITACPGFIRSARYVSEDRVNGKRRYLTAYELESHEAIESREFGSRRGWGRFRDDVNAKVTLYRRIATEEHGEHYG